MWLSSLVLYWTSRHHYKVRGKENFRASGIDWSLWKHTCKCWVLRNVLRNMCRWRANAVVRMRMWMSENMVLWMLRVYTLVISFIFWWIRPSHLHSHLRQSQVTIRVICTTNPSTFRISFAMNTVLFSASQLSLLISSIVLPQAESIAYFGKSNDATKKHQVPSVFEMGLLSLLKVCIVTNWSVRSVVSWLYTSQWRIFKISMIV